MHTYIHTNIHTYIQTYTHTYIHIYIYGPRQRSRYSDSLPARRSRDRIPAEAKLSIPVQNGSGVHPASCILGTGCWVLGIGYWVLGYVSRGKAGGVGVDYLLPSAYIHTYIHTYMHAYIHTYIHTYKHAYIHT